MDFESFLQNEALRALSIVYSRALLDSPDTATIIARLPPPRIAMLHHAALLRAPLTRADCTQPQVAERLTARIVAAYDLEHVTGPPRHPSNDARAAAASLSSPPPLLCSRYASDGATLQHVEHAMARRELELQQSVVESVVQLRGREVSKAPASPPPSPQQ